MPLSLQVVDTAAMSVKLRLVPIDNAGATVGADTPQHTHDQIWVDRVDITIFDNLSAPPIPEALPALRVPERNIYHRLALHMPMNDANFVANPSLATENFPNTRKVLDLIPVLGVHNLQQANGTSSSNDTGFTAPRNTFDMTSTPTSTINNTLIGTASKQITSYTKIFRFDLQYQVDPMNNNGSGIAYGRLNNNNWNDYLQEIDQNIVVSHNNGLTYRLRVTYSHTVDPGVGKQDLLWVASENVATRIPATDLNLNGAPYTPQIDTIFTGTVNLPATPYTANAINLLYINYDSAGSLNNVINPNVDYVLELADRDVDNIVDDVYEVTIPAKTEISIRDHLLYRQGGALIGTGAIKLFKGRTTRIHTDLHWSRVSLTAYDLNINDDDVILNNLSSDKVDLTTAPRGWVDFDGGQTRIGVGLDLNGRVFLQIKLGNASTGVNFDALYVNHVTATSQIMSTFNP